MEYMEKIKKMLCKELEEFAETGKLKTPADISMLKDLTGAIKNIDKIEMYEEEKEGYSEARMDRRYSKDDAKDHLMSALGEAMEGASPNEREILKDCMRKLERA